MFSLSAKRDGFRLLLPDEFIPDEIQEKYTKILKESHSFITKPIEFLNETIQKIEVLGFSSGSLAQQQTNHGNPIRLPGRIDQNWIQGGASDVNYRSVASPVALVDHTLNIDFRHTLGYVNYFLLFESFCYQYCRDTENLDKNLDYSFNVDLLNENGCVYSRIVLDHPVIDGVDMLQFDYTQPLAQSATFRCVFKYSNFDYQFIQTDANNRFEEEQPFEKPIEESVIIKKKEDTEFKNYPYSIISVHGNTTDNIDLNHDPKINDDCGPSDNSKTYIDYDGSLIK